MSNPNSWRDDLSAVERAKLDELDNVIRPEFIRRFAERRKARREKEEAEATAKPGDEAKPGAEQAKSEGDRQARYNATIVRLAVLFDVSMFQYDRDARQAANEFKTTKTVIDADVKKWRKEHKPEPEPEKDRQSQLQRLVGIGRAETLWHDGDGAGYASFIKDGHFEHHRIISKSFLGWLRRAYSQRFAVNINGEWVPQMPGSAALKDAVEAIEGYALDSGVQTPASFRVARERGAIFLDLGRPDWSAIQVTRQSVMMVRNPGMFRPSGQHALPIPGTGPGRGVEDLRRLVNVKREDFVLVVGFLLGVISGGPCPVLIVTGGEDSAKTTLCRVLKRLIDPDAKDLRTPPRNVEDLMVGARHSWIVGYDNVSFVSPEVSDAMCRLSSGGSMTKRALYTDGDEFSMLACRPILLNGIPDKLASRPDLIDRMILIKAPPITSTKRKTEEEFWREFKAAHTYILGALLEGVAAALRNAHKIDMKEEKPRLFGFAQWAEAGCQALGFAPGAFIEAYLTNRENWRAARRWKIIPSRNQ